MERGVQEDAGQVTHRHHQTSGGRHQRPARRRAPHPRELIRGWILWDVQESRRVQREGQAGQGFPRQALRGLGEGSRTVRVHHHGGSHRRRPREERGRAR